MEKPKLNPGFYYDGDRIVDANGKVVSLEKATGQPEPQEAPVALNGAPDVEFIATYLSTNFGIERSSEESAEEFVGRVGGGYNFLSKQVESQSRMFDASYNEAQDEIKRIGADLTTANQQLDATKTQLAERRTQLAEASEAAAQSKAELTDVTKERDALKTDNEKLKKDLEKAKKGAAS